MTRIALICALAAVVSVAVSLPSTARAQTAGGTADIGSFGGGDTAAALKQLTAPLQIPAGTFDPRGPRPEEVARWVEKERRTKDDYPEYFQVTEVYVVSPVDENNGSPTGLWFTRYRTNLRLGVVPDIAFIEVLAYDRDKGIPLSGGGFFMPDPAWTIELMSAEIARGGGLDAAAVAAWLAAHPQPGGVAAAGVISAIMVGLLGILNGIGSAPKPGTGRATGRALPPQLTVFNAKYWHWVNRNGSWVLVQGVFIEKPTWSWDPAIGAERGWEIGEFYPLGTPLTPKIFDVPDPSLLGDNLRTFVTPTPDLSAQAGQVATNLPGWAKSNLAPANWAGLSDSGRQRTLTAAIHEGAKANGLDPATFFITYGNDNDVALGGWMSKGGVLFINTNCKNYGNPRTTLAVALHEIRHAAQDKPTNTLGAPGDVGYRNLMNHNNANYTQPSTDPTRYAGQLKERDSQAFGEAAADAILGPKAGGTP